MIKPVNSSISNSVPVSVFEILYLRVAPASRSVAVTLPIDFWFSSAVNEKSEAVEENTAGSFTLSSVTVISWFVTFVSSVTVTVALYDLIARTFS